MDDRKFSVDDILSEVKRMQQDEHPASSTVPNLAKPSNQMSLEEELKRMEKQAAIQSTASERREEIKRWVPRTEQQQDTKKFSVHIPEDLTPPYEKEEQKSQAADRRFVIREDDEVQAADQSSTTRSVDTKQEESRRGGFHIQMEEQPVERIVDRPSPYRVPPAARRQTQSLSCLILHRRKNSMVLWALIQ